MFHIVFVHRFAKIQRCAKVLFIFLSEGLVHNCQLVSQKSNKVQGSVGRCTSLWIGQTATNPEQSLTVSKRLKNLDAKDAKDAKDWWILGFAAACKKKFSAYLLKPYRIFRKIFFWSCPTVNIETFSVWV